MATHYTYATLTTAIRDYTEVDSSVFTQGIIDDFIMSAEHRINIDCQWIQIDLYRRVL